MLHVGPEKLAAHAQLKPLADPSTEQNPPFMHGLCGVHAEIYNTSRQM